MKMNNMSKKKKTKLYTQLANQIKKFNRKSSRKLRLFLGSKNKKKRKPSLQNQINIPNSPSQNILMAQYAQRPQITAHLSNPSPAESTPENPKQKRSLFLDGIIGSIAGGAGNIGAAAANTAGDIGSAAKETAGGVGSALGANGGAGVGLLGAGAGLMMATMGSEDEQNERDNLSQDLRSKEFKFLMEQSKKSGEMGTLDKHVSFFGWCNK